MGRKPSYFTIGLFVIMATGLLLAAVVVFGAGVLARHERYFETYFDESITGLTLGAAVEFRGVPIGEVETITFVAGAYPSVQEDRKQADYAAFVRVVFSVPRQNMPEFAIEETDSVLDRMIAQGLRVRVNSNILTGQAYLEVNYLDPNRFAILQVPWEPINYYIPSAPSELTSMKESLDNILYSLQEIDVAGLVETFQAVLDSLNGAISDADLGQVSLEMTTLLRETRQKVKDFDAREISQASQRLLASLDQAVVDANVPGLSAEAQQFITEIRRTNESLRQLLAMSPDASTNLPEVLARLDRALLSVDRLVSGERPQIEVIIANFREISDNLKELTESLREQPSELLFNKPPRKSEAYK